MAQDGRLGCRPTPDTLDKRSANLRLRVRLGTRWFGVGMQAVIVGRRPAWVRWCRS